MALLQLDLETRSLLLRKNANPKREVGPRNFSEWKVEETLETIVAFFGIKQEEAQELYGRLERLTNKNL